MMPKHANGTLCLGHHIDADDVVKECKLWMAGGRTGSLGGRGVSEEHDEAIFHWLDAVFQDGVAEGAHLNLTECEVLKEAIDDSCAFNMNAVNEFSQKLKTSDGFSVAFWVKAVDSSSLSDSGKFFPHISLLHSISPPEPYFAMSKMADWTYNTIDLRSYDSDGEPVKKQSFLQDLSPSDWNFVSYSNKFHVAETENGGGQGQGSGGAGSTESFVIQNSRVISEIDGLDFREGDHAAFFKGIEVNTPLLISPIMLIPRFRSAKELQEEYNLHAHHMAVRRGPPSSDRVRKESRVPVEKTEFVGRSTLMAAPILFQTMAQKTTQCPFNYSSEFLYKMHSRAVQDKCDASVYNCDGQILDSVESIMSCLDTAGSNTTFFGLDPTVLNGETGYADFLSSIADNAFVYRNGITPTSTFINSATQMAQVSFVFFTPVSGLVTGAIFI